MKKLLLTLLAIIFAAFVIFEVILFCGVNQAVGLFDYYSSVGIYNEPYLFMGGKMQAFPTMKNVIVRINAYVPDFVYSMLELDLKALFMANSHVVDVYRNNGGTITMVCR